MTVGKEPRRGTELANTSINKKNNKKKFNAGAEADGPFVAEQTFFMDVKGFLI